MQKRKQPGFTWPAKRARLQTSAGSNGSGSNRGNVPQAVSRGCWILILFVLLLATGRFTALLASPDPDLAEIPVQHLRAAVWPSPARPLQVPVELETGDTIERIEYQQFDPTAVVVVTAGADGEPGTAGADDDGNGLIDDRSELGATYSDDICRVLTASQHQSRHTDPVLILQRGAWAAVEDIGAAKRAIVTGTSNDDQPWSMVLER